MRSSPPRAPRGKTTVAGAARRLARAPAAAGLAAAILLLALGAALARQALRPDHACGVDEPAWIQSGYATFRLVAELAPPSRWESAYDARGLGSFGNLNPPAGKLLLGAAVALARDPTDPVRYAWEWPLDHAANLERGNLPPDALLRRVRLAVVALAVLLLAVVYACAVQITGAPWISLLAPVALFLSPVFRAQASEVALGVPQMLFALTGVVAIQQHLRRGGRARGLFGLACLGLSCAVRYSTAPLVAATAAFALLRPVPPVRRLRRAALAAGLPLAVFVAVNPYLYPDPAGRIAGIVAAWSELKAGQREDPLLAGSAVPSRTAGLALVTREALARPRLTLPSGVPAEPYAGILAGGSLFAVLAAGWRRRRHGRARALGLAAAALGGALCLGAISAGGALLGLGVTALVARAHRDPEPGSTANGRGAVPPQIGFYLLVCSAFLVVWTGLWLPLAWPKYHLPALVLLAPLAAAGLQLPAQLARAALAGMRGRRGALASLVPPKGGAAHLPAVPTDPRDRTAPARARSAPLLAAALAVVTLAYANAPGAPFLWDDHHLIAGDPRVGELRPLREYFGAGFFGDDAPARARAYYRPLVTLSFALDQKLSGGRAFGFHVTNLFLHLLCCALVFGLCRRGGVSATGAALATALFGTLPRLTESVTWVSGRTDVSAAAGVLAALALHSCSPGRIGRRLAGALALLAGLLCKEVAAAGVPALVAFELAERRRDAGSLGRTARHLAPALAALAIYTVLRSSQPLLLDQPHGLSAAERGLTALQALGTYTLMLLDPLRPRLQIGVLGVFEPGAIAVGGLVLALPLLPLVQRLRGPAPLSESRSRSRSHFVWVRTGGVLAIAALLPALHLVPISLDVVAADRFLYLPAAGLVVALACAGAAWAERRTRPERLHVAAVAGLAVLVFAAATHVRNRDYGDELRLWEVAAARSDPANPTPPFELANQLAWRGRPRDAIAQYRRSLRAEEALARVQPELGRSPDLRANLALALSEVGAYEEAVALLRWVVAAEPDSGRRRLELGAVLARALELDAAERELRRARELAPGNETVARMLAQVRAARALLERLPPPREDEPLEVTAERAAAYVLVGRLRAAEPLFGRIARHPGASQDLLRRAASFLVARGELEAAERAVARLRANDPRAAALARAVSERRRARP